MIKAVLVDDERPALRELEYFLRDYPVITIQDKFTDPQLALEKIKSIQPQIIFLDINMPQLKGIDAASKFMDLCEKVDIVFVTAYDSYAIQAFELYTLDYLLKPLTEDRFYITMQRIMNKYGTIPINDKKNLMIKCLGKFEISWRGEEPIKWRTEKTRELFAFLLHHRNRNLSKEELLDALWAEDDPEKAIRQLYNGIYYIRKALEEYGIGRNLISIDGNYNLKLGPVDFDVEYYNQFARGHDNSNLGQLEEIEILFQGDYLQGEYYPWADLERERLSSLHLRCLLQLAKELKAARKWDKAENYLVKAYHKNPYYEETTELLLKLYEETGNSSKAILHYNTYTKLIHEELGIQPDKKLHELVRTIK
ncbi:MAG: hypothetical protein APF84_09420 [Gracilibacter sp. BRH_c7a]|nr:MAG: hypothetical protein APF84_09420 [Gracilibacter sp. BRH_c7a]